MSEQINDPRNCKTCGGERRIDFNAGWRGPPNVERHNWHPCPDCAHLPEVVSDQIHYTVSLEQAEALIEAAACLAVAADGDTATLEDVYLPERRLNSAEADRYKVEQARRAVEAVAGLRTEVDNVHKRDPELQDMLHALKMRRKHGPAF